jgi:hypothetical protein
MRRDFLLPLCLALAISQKIEAPVSGSDIQEGFNISERVKINPEIPEGIAGSAYDILRLFSILSEICAEVIQRGSKLLI